MGPRLRLREGRKGVPLNSHCVQVPRGKTLVTVGTAAGVHLGARPSEPNKPSGTPKLATTGTGTASVSPASIEAAPSCTSRGTSGVISSPLNVALNSTTPTTAQVDKRVPPVERRNRNQVCLGWKTRADSWTGLARSPLASSWHRWKEFLMLCPRLPTVSRPLSTLFSPSMGEKVWVFIRFLSQRTDACAWCWKTLVSPWSRLRFVRSWKHCT